MRKTDTISFIRNKQSEQEEPESSEVVEKHNEQAPVEFETLEVWRSIQERKKLSQHSAFVMTINVTYCLLIENGEPSNYQEAINSLDSSLWMIAM